VQNGKPLDDEYGQRCLRLDVQNGKPLEDEYGQRCLRGEW